MSTNGAGNISRLDNGAIALLQALIEDPKVRQDPDLIRTLRATLDALLASASSSTATLSSTSPATVSVAGAPKIYTVSPFMKIDTGGSPGANGYPPSYATQIKGGRGVRGTDATDGQHARDIHLRLCVQNDTVVGQWAQGIGAVKLGDPSASIILCATGGQGSRGGPGGEGGVGAAGARGQNATHDSAGEDGKRGATGGLGGEGGAGGNGGKGGNVIVSTTLQDSDLLMLVRPPEMAGGAPGKGGSAGPGGKGGDGGEGGAACSWDERQLTSQMVPNTFGSGLHSQLRATSVSRYNPGGHRGPKGLDGPIGSPGSDGKPGIPGSLQWVVDSMAFRALYDLSLTVSKVVDARYGNPEDVYEPGEQVYWIVSARNTGGMPTPPQEIEISPLPATWLETTGSPPVLKMTESLPVGGYRVLQTPIAVRLRDQAPANEEPFAQQATLTFQALSVRVNRFFPGVTQQKHPIPISYPVQISRLEGKISVIRDEASVLHLFVRNLTTIRMGQAGPQKRRVFVVFEVAQAGNAVDTKLTKTREQDHQGSNQVNVEIEDLPPQDQQKLNVSFSYSHAPPLITTVDVVASLFLDYFRAANSEPRPPRCIQKRTISMQLS